MNTTLHTPSLLENHKLIYALSGRPVKLPKGEVLLYDLLQEMANDKNSSKFREDVTKLMLGLRPSEGKLGYDDDFEPIEVKPQNYSGGDRKLNGQGKFTDFTWKRHAKYMEDNVRMLVSGFTGGKLLFIVEFPYTNLEGVVLRELKRLLPQGDMPNRYVRALVFNHKHWRELPHVVHFVSRDIAEHKGAMVKDLYEHLTVTP